MRRIAVFLVGAALAAAAASSALAAERPSSPSPEEAEKAFFERYEIVIERNIFSRDRPRRVVRPWEVPREAEAPRPAEPPPEESHVLTGVVREGRRYIAFIEDAKAGRTIKAKVGDAVARGRVAAITIDGIVYERGGERTEVEIGRTLSGRPASFPSASAPRGGPPARSERGPLSAPPGAGGPPGAAAAPSANGAPAAASTPSGAGAPSGAGGPNESAAPGEAAPAATPEGGGSSEADIIERMRQRRLRELEESKS